MLRGAAIVRHDDLHGRGRLLDALLHELPHVRWKPLALVVRGNRDTDDEGAHAILACCMVAEGKRAQLVRAGTRMKPPPPRRKRRYRDDRSGVDRECSASGRGRNSQMSPRRSSRIIWRSISRTNSAGGSNTRARSYVSACATYER